LSHPPRGDISLFSLSRSHSIALTFTIKQIHNYVDRISPHLLNYPRYTDSAPPPQEQQQQPEQHQQEEHHEEQEEEEQQEEEGQEGQEQEEEEQQDAPPERATPYIQPAEPTPLDNALRTLVQELEPYRLTKGEILMLINLGVGLKSPNPLAEDGGVAETVEEQQQEEEEDELDFTTRAIINSAIEEQEERFSDEDVLAIVTIVRNTLGKPQG
jgi:hypothetical protein